VRLAALLLVAAAAGPRTILSPLLLRYLSAQPHFVLWALFCMSDKFFLLAVASVCAFVFLMLVILAFS
jgi:hypothetical protein